MCTGITLLPVAVVAMAALEDALEVIREQEGRQLVTEVDGGFGDVAPSGGV